MERGGSLPSPTSISESVCSIDERSPVYPARLWRACLREGRSQQPARSGSAASPERIRRQSGAKDTPPREEQARDDGARNGGEEAAPVELDQEVLRRHLRSVATRGDQRQQRWQWPAFTVGEIGDSR